MKPITRWLFLLFAQLVCTMPTHAADKMLVTANSVGDVKVGMTKTALLTLAGKGAKVAQKQCEYDPMIDPIAYEIVRWKDFEVLVVKNKVLSITTTSPYARTAEGYAIGMPTERVKGFSIGECDGEGYVGFIGFGDISGGEIRRFIVGNDNVCEEDC